MNCRMNRMFIEYLAVDNWLEVERFQNLAVNTIEMFNSDKEQLMAIPFVVFPLWIWIVFGFFFFLLRLGFGFRTENNPNETIMISKDHKTRNEHVYHGHDGGSHNFTYFGKGIPPRIQCEFVTLN